MPRRPGRTEGYLDYFFPADADPDWVAGYLELDDQVGAEDRELVESVQRGMRSRALRARPPDAAERGADRRLPALGRRGAGLSLDATPVVWSERHRLHEPGGEVWVGVRTPGTEVPERAERIRAELRAGAARASAEAAAPTPMPRCAAVHDAALLDYLRGGLGATGRPPA